MRRGEQGSTTCGPEMVTCGETGNSGPSTAISAIDGTERPLAECSTPSRMTSKEPGSTVAPAPRKIFISSSDSHIQRAAWPPRVETTSGVKRSEQDRLPPMPARSVAWSKATTIEVPYGSNCADTMSGAFQRVYSVDTLTESSTMSATLRSISLEPLSKEQVGQGAEGGSIDSNVNVALEDKIVTDAASTRPNLTMICSDGAMSVDNWKLVMPTTKAGAPVVGPSQFLHRNLMLSSKNVSEKGASTGISPLPATIETEEVNTPPTEDSGTSTSNTDCKVFDCTTRLRVPNNDSPNVKRTEAKSSVSCPAASNFTTGAYRTKTLATRAPSDSEGTRPWRGHPPPPHRPVTMHMLALTTHVSQNLTVSTTGLCRK
mmetsp:Transcript_48722/g.99498  ORF Transcript_48722/g.99498 Transcript_48722/m.99498 type:complete len:373 (-) Transcript_48722:8388-9506(-)